MDDQRLEQEQVINISDYIGMIIKRKKIILAIFLISVIAVTVVTSLSPTIYGISMIIEPGLTAISDQGDRVYLPSDGNMPAKIEHGIFNKRIIKALNLDPRTELEFNVSQLGASHFIKVNMEQEGEKIELGLKILNQLFNEISDDFAEIMKSKNNMLQRQISIFSNAVIEKNNTIKSLEANLSILEKREDGLIEEMKEVRANSEKLLTARENMLKNTREKRSYVDDISSLVYSNAIQQETSYLNNLSNQITELRLKKETTLDKIGQLTLAIEDLKLKIGLLTFTSENIHNVVFVKEPTVSKYPIKPNKRRNIAVAGMASLAFGIFLVFFMDFWKPSEK